MTVRRPEFHAPAAAGKSLQAPAAAGTMRRGMTLVELLVVVAILLALSTITLRAFTPSLKDRQIREGARVLNAAIQGARAKALQTGRKHGFVLERYTIKDETISGSNVTGTVRMMPTACRRIYTVAEQPPYQGDYVNSVATYRIRGGAYQLIRLGSAPLVGTSGSNANAGDIDLGWQGTRNGDMLWIDGRQFEIAAPSVDANTGRIINPPTESAPWILTQTGSNYQVRGKRSLFVDSTAQSGDVIYEGTYKIARPPVKVVGSEVELPEGVCIHMESSGWVDSSENFDNNGVLSGRADYRNGFRAIGTLQSQNTAGEDAYTDLPVVIWFGGDGSMAEMWWGGWPAVSTPLYSTYAMSSQPNQTIAQPILPSGRTMVNCTRSALANSVFFLICPLDEAYILPFASGATVRHAWMKPDNRWVTLSSTSGKVQTAPVAINNSGRDFPQNIRESRTYARKAIALPGT